MAHARYTIGALAHKTLLPSALTPFAARASAGCQLRLLSASSSSAAAAVAKLRVADVIAARTGGAPTSSIPRPRAVELSTPATQVLRRLFEDGAAMPRAGSGSGEGSWAVLVVDGREVVKGIITEKDYVMKLTHGSFAPHDIAAQSLMHTEGLAFAGPSTRALTVMRSMLAQGRRHVPILTRDAAARLGGGGGGGAGAPLSADSVRLEDLHGLLSLRDFVSVAADAVKAAAVGAGMGEDDLKVGVSSKKKENATNGSNNSGGGGGDAASSSSPAAGPLNFLSRVDDVLAAMKARGKRVLVNTRLSDALTVSDAANTMAEKNMSAVAVVDEAGRCVGVFTSRDLVSRVLVPGHNAAALRVSEVMTGEVTSAAPETSVLRAARAMVKRGISHLPVSDAEGRVVGLLSFADVGRALIGGMGDGGGDGAAQGAGWRVLAESE